MMATVATFTVAADEFPLGSVFEDLPGVTVELERMVPTTGAVVPYFWVRGVEENDVVQRFRETPGASGIRLVDSVDAEYLLRWTWDPTEVSVLRAIRETGVSLLSGVGTSTRWTFKVRGDDRETVARFQAYCLDNDIPITLSTLQQLHPGRRGQEYGLTDPQRQALLLAYDRGYFDTPRRATLEEIAAELDISRQSLAARLRRGHRNLVEHTLVTDGAT